MVTEYFGQGERNYAFATIGSISLNLLFQSLIAFMQNRAKAPRRQLKEQIYVWTMIKPGVDAWRVASGSLKEQGQIIDALSEFSYNKGAELVSEAIPGVIIQLAAIMRPGSGITRTALFSFVFSLITAAFTSCALSHDWDVSTEKRKLLPKFYGYIPDDTIGKIRVVGSLFLLSAFNLLTRSFACILLYLKGGLTMTATVLGSEFLAYMLIKVFRGDFWYWVPVYGRGELFMTLTARWTVKMVTDWTACVQFRHPNEVGGAYFTFSLLVTIIIGLIAAFSYSQKDYDDKDQETLAPHIVTVVMIIASMGIILSYATLLASIKRAYRRTFISTKTSNESVQAQFTDNEEDDQKRFLIFEDSRRKWENKIGEDVKVWVNNRLPVWLKEEPAWFTLTQRSMIPDNFIKDRDIRLQIKTKEVRGIARKRRASIVMGVFAGDDTECITEDEVYSKESVPKSESDGGA